MHLGTYIALIQLRTILKKSEISFQHGIADTKHKNTWIKFELPSEAKISLEVYGLGGNIVATLLNEVKPAGKHTFNLPKENIESGSYYLRFAAYGNNEIPHYVNMLKLKL